MVPIEKRRKEVLAAANAVSHEIMSNITEGKRTLFFFLRLFSVVFLFTLSCCSVSKVFNNQRLLEFEAKKMQQLSGMFLF